MRFPSAFALLVAGPLALSFSGCASGPQVGGADRELSTQLARSERTSDHLIEMAQEYEATGRTTEARRIYELILDSDSDHAEARRRLELVDARAKLNRELASLRPVPTQTGSRLAGATGQEAEEPRLLQVGFAEDAAELAAYVETAGFEKSSNHRANYESSEPRAFVPSPSAQVASSSSAPPKRVQQVSWITKLNPFAKKPPEPKMTPEQYEAQQVSMARMKELEFQEKMRKREIQAIRSATRKGRPLPAGLQQQYNQPEASLQPYQQQRPAQQSAQPTGPFDNRYQRPTEGNGPQQMSLSRPENSPRVQSSEFEILPLNEPIPSRTPISNAATNDPLAEWNLFDDVAPPKARVTPRSAVAPAQKEDPFWDLSSKSPEPRAELDPNIVIEPVASDRPVAPKVAEERIWDLSERSIPTTAGKTPPATTPQHPLGKQEPIFDLLPPRETPKSTVSVPNSTPTSTPAVTPTATESPAAASIAAPTSIRSGLFDDEVDRLIPGPATPRQGVAPIVPIEPVLSTPRPERPVTNRLAGVPAPQPKQQPTPATPEIDQLPPLDPLLDLSEPAPQQPVSRIAKPVEPVVDLARRSTDYQSIPQEPAIELDSIPAVNPLWSGPALTTYCPNLSPKLRSIVERLDFQDIEVRKQALADLAMHGPDAMTAIPAVEVLVDDVPIVAAHAAWTLLQIDGDQQTTAHVMQQLIQEKDEEVVQFAAYALGSIGPHARPATSQLRQARERYSGITRLHIAEALTRIDAFDEGSVDILVDSLHDRERQHRWLAAIALGQVSTRHANRVVPALTASLRDSDPQVRSAAALSVGRFGPAARSAVNELQSRAALDAPEVREAARTSLACIPH